MWIVGVEFKLSSRLAVLIRVSELAFTNLIIPSTKQGATVVLIPMIPSELFH